MLDRVVYKYLDNAKLKSLPYLNQRGLLGLFLTTSPAGGTQPPATNFFWLDSTGLMSSPED